VELLYRARDDVEAGGLVRQNAENAEPVVYLISPTQAEWPRNRGGELVIGRIRNLDNDLTAHIICTSDPGEWLLIATRAELRQRGVESRYVVAITPELPLAIAFHIDRLWCSSGADAMKERMSIVGFDYAIYSYGQEVKRGRIECAGRQPWQAAFSYNIALPHALAFEAGLRACMDLFIPTVEELLR
jgi:hypothetical protein